MQIPPFFKRTDNSSGRNSLRNGSLSAPPPPRARARARERSRPQLLPISRLHFTAEDFASCCCGSIASLLWSALKVVKLSSVESKIGSFLSSSFPTLVACFYRLLEVARVLHSLCFLCSRVSRLFLVCVCVCVCVCVFLLCFLHLLLQCRFFFVFFVFFVFFLGWYFDYCYPCREHCCFIVITTSVLQSVICVVFCVCMFKWCCSVDGCVCRDLGGSGDKALESIELNVGACLLVACCRICVFPFCC